MNTLFVGKEETPGHFIEVCMQCGNCVLAHDGGYMPAGQVRQEPAQRALRRLGGWQVRNIARYPCAWQLIYDRLKALGQLDKLEEIVPVRDWSTSTSGRPAPIRPLG